MDDRSYTNDRTSDTGRFGAWLGSRPAESWMFFVVGVFLGGFFF
jgi:hypothetical protein